jgi:hypothetical protein
MDKNQNINDAFRSYWAETHDGVWRNYRQQSKNDFIAGWNAAIDAAVKSLQDNPERMKGGEQ